MIRFPKHLCELLGVDLPIVQAPIGSASTPALAAEVSNAGGLGTLALTWTSPEEAVRRVRETRRRTDRPFAVNLVLDFAIDALLEACLAEEVPIVSTFWGDPATVAPRVREAGARLVHTVGSVAEAQQAADAGVDAVVAQGWEAGGHVRGQASTMVLVPAVVDAVAPLPVLAAGGIADRRGLAAALALGASGGWLGTRFLTAVEAATHDSYREAVVAAELEDSVYTRCFAGGWPDAPHRALRNSTLSQWEGAGRPSSERPGEGDVVATDADGRAWRRYEDMVPVPGMTGDLEALARYAGQSAGLVREVVPAAQIVAELAAGLPGR